MDSEKVEVGVGSEVEAGSTLNDNIEVESVASAADAEAAPSADSPRASEQLPQLFGEQLQAGVEALLFASGEPLPVDRIVALTGGDAAAVEAALIILGNRYAHESSGLQLLRVAGGIQIRSDVAFAPYIRAL